MLLLLRNGRTQIGPFKFLWLASLCRRSFPGSRLMGRGSSGPLPWVDDEGPARLEVLRIPGHHAPKTGSFLVVLKSGQDGKLRLAYPTRGLPPKSWVIRLARLSSLLEVIEVVKTLDRARRRRLERQP